jgi:hypothetical protein
MQQLDMNVLSCVSGGGIGSKVKEKAKKLECDARHAVQGKLSEWAEKGNERREEASN